MVVYCLQSTISGGALITYTTDEASLVSCTLHMAEEVYTTSQMNARHAA